MFIYQKATDVIDYLPLAEDVEVKVGTCLVMGEDGLAICGNTASPEYISNTEATGDGTAIPVQKITDDATLVGVLSADSDALKVGAKMTLAADGVAIGATAGGALEVIAFEGNKAGDKVIVAVK